MKSYRLHTARFPSLISVIKNLLFQRLILFFRQKTFYLLLVYNILKWPSENLNMARVLKDIKDLLLVL